MDEIELDPEEIELIEKETFIKTCIKDLNKIEKEINLSKGKVKKVKFEKLYIIGEQIDEILKEMKEAE